MSWQCGQLMVADPTWATVSGTSMAGGAVHIDVGFRLVEWEEKGPLSLVPQPSEVTARAGRGRTPARVCAPDPRERAVARQPLVDGNGTVHVVADCVRARGARNGTRWGPLELVMTLTACPFVISRYQGYAPGVGIQPTFDTYAFKVPKEQWLAVLKSVGYCDSILTELRLPRSGCESTSVGRQRVVNAVNARNDGRRRNTVQECRLALDALKTAGFGGRAPEVAQFLKKNARNLSQVECFSALQIAMQLFLLPAHHDGVSDEEFSREDADLAIAMIASLLRFAPRWGADTTETSETTESAA